MCKGFGSLLHSFRPRDCVITWRVKQQNNENKENYTKPVQNFWKS